MKYYNKLLDNKYLCKEKIGKGGFSVVVLVIDKSNNNEYAAKILYKEEVFEKELTINKMLSNLNNINIERLVNYNRNGTMVNQHDVSYQIKYFIFEYEEKGDLMKYAITKPNLGEEKTCKIIFKKILEAVQEIHQNGIFHLDIKLQNVLLDKNYEPKLSDFGLAEISDKCDENGKLNFFVGTPYYCSPQIQEREPYDGTKADIYSLGILLFVLALGKFPYNDEKEFKKFNKFTKSNQQKELKKYINDKIKKIKISETFQNLFLEMVKYNEESRPTIKNILKNKWFKEVTNLNDDEIINLDNEVYTTFCHREYFFKKEKPNYEEFKGMNKEDNEAEFKKYFYYGIKIKKENPQIYKYNYIKINEKIEKTKIVDIMNQLADICYKEFSSSIDCNEDFLKFNAIFNVKKCESDENSESSNESNDNEEKDNESEENKDDDEDNDNYSVQRKLIIQIKLYENKNNGYILLFKKKEGDLGDYYIILKKIFYISEKLLYKIHKDN